MNQSQSENNPHGQPLSRRRTRLHILVVSVGLISLGAVLGVLGAASASALAGFGGPGFGGHWDGHHGKGPVSLEQMRERTGDRLDWVLGALDASDEQAGRIKAIGMELATDLYPLRQQHRDNKRQIMSQLTGPDPDPAVLEDLRRKELELADVASARVLAALLKGRDILTQEQRDKLTRHLRHRRH